MHDSNLKLKLPLIYFIMYSGFSCYFGFLTPYFLDRKLSYVQIGAAFALMAFISIVVQPGWGYITDKYLNKKKTLVLLLSVCSVLMLTLAVARSYVAVMICLFFVQFFHCPLMAISDAYCYDITEESKTVHYGKIRLMGSAGYAIGALVLGYIAQFFGINSPYFAYTLLMVVTLLMLVGIDFKGKKAESKPHLGDALNIVRNAKFSIFVLSVMVFNIALGAHNNNAAVLIEKTGGNVSSVGILWSVIAFSELPLFFLGGRIISRFGELNMYLFAVAVYGFRFFLSSISGSYVAVIAIQAFQGLAYPFYLMGALQYVSKIVPSGLKATSITLLSSLGFGLGNFLGSLMGGAVMQRFDVFILYKLIAVICISGVAVGFIPKLLGKNTQTA